MGILILINLDLAATIDPLDGILIDVARRIQVPKMKHEEAADHFMGLCAHVDREGSPLEGKVLESYPSGSFSIAAAIYSHVRSMQHDVCHAHIGVGENERKRAILQP